MKVGVTGTREGMSPFQTQQVAAFLKEFILLAKQAELHHGDCVGVDAEVAAIAKDLGYTIISHPPKEKKMRAFFESHEYKQPDGYLARDRNIVDSTDFLIVVPLQNEWQPRGGTWYTYNHAVKTKKPVELFYPGVGK